MKISQLNVGSKQSKTAQGFLASLALTAALTVSMAFPANAHSTTESSSDKPVSTLADKRLIAAAPTAATITWQKSLSKTLQLAKTNKKWILVDVYTDWCHWCKKLDSDVYAQPAMAKFLNKSFICLKANAEDKGDGTAINSKYGVQGYPTTLILEPSGKEKGRIESYLAAGEFAKEITRILNK